MRCGRLPSVATRSPPDEGLIVKWRSPVNGSYAGPAVADGRVFVLDYVGTEPRTMDGIERILALDEETGEVPDRRRRAVDVGGRG